jgi:thiamine phosphate synthase YjbQ (UPF0047 family)
MKSHTEYLTFELPRRRGLVRITDDVARCCAASGIAEGMVVGHQVIVPVTKGRLDLGPWQQIFYYEFDGRRRKRLVLKVLGE